MRRIDPKIVQMLKQLATQFPVTIEPVPLATWRDQILLRYQQRRRSRSTIDGLTQTLREVIEIAGPDATTACLTPEFVETFVLATPSGRKKLARKARTVNTQLGHLRAACHIAIEEGWLAVSPFGPNTPWADVEGEQHRERHHSRETIAKVLAHLSTASDWKGRRLHALACVYAYTGLRRNEALSLKVADIDFKTKLVHVRRHGRRLKTLGSAAPVPMPAALRATLAAWVPIVGSEWLFPGAKLKRRWTGGAVNLRASDLLKQAAAEVGVSGFTPQSLRRSLATHYVGAWKLSPRQLQSVLRHSNQTTQSHYIEQDRTNLVAMVDGFSYGEPALSLTAEVAV